MFPLKSETLKDFWPVPFGLSHPEFISVTFKQKPDQPD